MCCVTHMAPALANRSTRGLHGSRFHRCRAPCGISGCLRGSKWGGYLRDCNPDEVERTRCPERDELQRSSYEDFIFTYLRFPGGGWLADSSLRRQPNFNYRYDEHNAYPTPNRDLDDDADAALCQG